MSIKDLDTDAERFGLEVGAPQLKSIGAITFGPADILFAADNVSATVHAIKVGDGGVSTGSPPQIDNLDDRLAALLGCSRQDLHVQDMAVPAGGGAVYVSVMRGSGEASSPVLIRARSGGELEEVELEHIPFASVAIGDAPTVDDSRTDIRVVPLGESADEERDVRGVHLRLARQPLRSATITDLAFVGDALLVAGASNEEFSSTLRRIPFPFGTGTSSTSLEIFHVSHGKYETASPIRTFAPYGELSVLASYTCTPLVRFSLADLKPGAQAKGRTVAELGSMNTPLDLVSYRRDGVEYVLVANSRHPLLRFAASDLDHQQPLVTPSEPVGPARSALPHEGVVRMANWNGSHVLMLQRDASGGLAMRAHDTSSL